MTRLNPEQWTQLWNDNAWINSFGEENYDSEIADFWQQQLDGITGNVIDLCCGNGAISWIANEILNKDKDCAKITGIDFSDIEPFSKLKLEASNFPMLNFIGNTAIEKLPFENSSIDLAISQYGLEYSRLELSIPELGRVLKPTSKMCFIVHGENSSIVKNTSSNITQYKMVLNDIKLHDKFLELDTLIKNTPDLVQLKNTPLFIAKSTEINGSIAILKQIEKTAKNPLPLNRYIQSMAAAFTEQAIAQGKKDRRAVVLKAKQDFKKYLDRILDLQAVALSDDDLGSLKKLIEQENFTIVYSDTLRYKDSANHGYVIVASR